MLQVDDLQRRNNSLNFRLSTAVAKKHSGARKSFKNKIQLRSALKLKCRTHELLIKPTPQNLIKFLCNETVWIHAKLHYVARVWVSVHTEVHTNRRTGIHTKADESELHVFGRSIIVAILKLLLCKTKVVYHFLSFKILNFY